MSDNYWKQPLRWNEAAQRAGERHRVFCGSMSDIFEDHPTNERERARLWTLIEQTPMLDWLLLTKRPENIDRMLPGRWWIADQGMPRNVWLGFSAEDQQRFDERWAIMEWVKRMWYPSVVFLSAEPLLGPLDIEDALQEIDLGDEEHQCWSATLDWVICGGESGHGARPMHPDWARSLQRQCEDAGVAYFFKQWGEWAPTAMPRLKKEHAVMSRDGSLLQPAAWDDVLAVSGDDWAFSRVGKKAAGRLLDGRTWDEFPN